MLQAGKPTSLARGGGRIMTQPHGEAKDPIGGSLWVLTSKTSRDSSN